MLPWVGSIDVRSLISRACRLVRLFEKVLEEVRPHGHPGDTQCIGRVCQLELLFSALKIIAPE